MRRALLLALLALACARTRVAPPVANQSPPPPNLTGRQVLLLPVQGRAQERLEAELGYWLEERAGQVKWVLPAAIDRTLVRNPGLNIKPRELDVVAFRRAQVKRIGDPLFGDLRRLAAIFDTRLALVPVAAELRPGADGTFKVEVALALIDTSFGDVLWFGVVAGDEAAQGAEELVTSAAQRVANLFAPPKTPG